MNNINYKTKYRKYKTKYLLIKQQIGKGNKIIAVSGISGAGKTTIGKQLTEKLHGVYLDNS